MDRRTLLAIVIGAVIVVAGIFALGTGLSGTGVSSGPAAGTGSAVAVATPSSSAPVTFAAPSALAVPSGVAATIGAAATPAATCIQVAQLVAVRATDPATGFPVKVAWTGLGPADDLFVTLSDVSPTIAITPTGPGALTLGLGYLTGGDQFAMTAGAVALVYDPATGSVTGELATGYGKNSNRATKDPQPSQLVAALVRPAGGTNGSLTGTIIHAGRRDYKFKVEMTEKTIQVASGPGCPSSRPTDAP